MFRTLLIAVVSAAIGSSALAQRRLISTLQATEFRADAFQQRDHHGPRQPDRQRDA